MANWIVARTIRRGTSYICAGTTLNDLITDVASLIEAGEQLVDANVPAYAAAATRALAARARGASFEESDSIMLAALSTSDVLGEYINLKDYGAVGDGTTDDSPALRAALADAVRLGIRVVYCGKGSYYLASRVVVPSNVTIRGAGRAVTFFISGLTPIANPTNATFFAAADAATAATALASGNTVGARTISSNASVAPGSIILLNDTVSGAGLRTMSYDVKAVTGSGPYTLTLDRPVLIQYATGDAISVIPAQPTDIVLEDFAIKGSADRFIEFVSSKNCIVRRIDMTVTAGASHDIMCSMDVGGRGNLQDDLCLDGGNIATDCLAQEGQDASTTRRCITSRSSGYGVVMHDAMHPVIEHCHGSFHGFGLVLTADGTTKGTIGARVRGGSFTNCTSEGIAIVNGSTDVMLDGVDARWNPKALTCSNDVSDVVATKCDLSNHTTNAISVGTGAFGIRLRTCNLTGSASTIPISAAGDLDLDGCRIEACKQIGLLTGNVTFRGCYMKCNPAAAQNVLYLSSGTPLVSLLQCELECATNSCNMVSIAAGVCVISQTTIKQVGGATGVLGLYISGGNLFIGSGVDASGCTTPLSSAGGTTKLVTETTVTVMSNPS